LDFNDSWDAVVNPGEGESYFEVHRDKPFEPDAPAYSAVNAWWLAEISRLVYKQGKDEPEPSKGELTRQAALAEVGLSETFVSDLQAPFALITPADLRFRIVAFRGSHNLVNWVTNLDSILTDCATGGRVHEGFQKALDTVWERLEGLLAAGRGSLFFTGHSRGAALATLAAARHGQPSQLYTYGSPFVGDEAFVSGLGNVSRYQVINHRDVVTASPPWTGFRRTGRVHYISHDGTILVDPTDEEIAADRLKQDRWKVLRRYAQLHFTDAPAPFADHAPINYVAHLERALLPEGRREPRA
jgi:triacylglycerol lipase